MHMRLMALPRPSREMAMGVLPRLHSRLPHWLLQQLPRWTAGQAQLGQAQQLGLAQLEPQMQVARFPWRRTTRRVSRCCYSGAMR